MEYIQQRMHFLISYFATGLDLLFKSCGERIFVKSNEIEEFFDFSQNLKFFYFSKIIAPHARIIQYLSPIFDVILSAGFLQSFGILTIAK